VIKRRTLKTNILLSLLLVSLLFFAFGPNNEASSSTLPADSHRVGWYLRWHDEFEDDSLDLSKWRAEDAALVKNNELQYYTPEDVYLEDGLLVLRSQERPMGGCEYTSGLVETVGKFSQQYGRFEIRAKLPKTRGMWPAHWLLPDDGSWPPEIDIMEMVGHNPRAILGSLHWGKRPNNRHYSAIYRGPDFSEDFHVFAIEWEPDEIRWYVNDEQYSSTRAYIPHQPFYIILNTAVGGDWPGSPDETTVFPQYHKIDYVRVYAKEVPGEYYLTTYADQGTISASPMKDRYRRYSPVKLLAEPRIGYKFSHWSGDLSTEDNPVRISMDKHKRIRANFVIDPEAPKVISQNKLAECSSVESPELGASNVTDGNLRTRWSSEFSDPQWVYIDLEESRLIEAIRLSWEIAYARDYEIQVSNDAFNWRTIYANSQGRGLVEEIKNLNTHARYIRMYGNRRAAEWGYSLWEFEVFGR
jgi:beta-glucanase (GH16 family)